MTSCSEWRKAPFSPLAKVEGESESRVDSVEKKVFEIQLSFLQTSRILSLIKNRPRETFLFPPFRGNLNGEVDEKKIHPVEMIQSSVYMNGEMWMDRECVCVVPTAPS